MATPAERRRVLTLLRLLELMEGGHGRGSKLPTCELPLREAVLWSKVVRNVWRTPNLDCQCQVLVIAYLTSGIIGHLSTDLLMS